MEDRSDMFRIILIISLSVNIFVFSSLAMYATWLATGFLLTTLWRGLTALFVWITSFGAGTLVFWRIVEMMGDKSPLEARSL